MSVTLLERIYNSFLELSTREIVTDGAFPDVPDPRVGQMSDFVVFSYIFFKGWLM